MGYAQDLVNAGYHGYQGWGDAEAQADFNATGGVGKGGSSSGGGSSGSSWDEFAKLFGLSAASPIEVPPIKVKTYEEYEALALEELKPYYKRILKEEGGDVKKAKGRLEEDYQRGIRIQREDWKTAKKNYGPQMTAGESPIQYYNRTKAEYGTMPTEGISQFSNLNRRGVASSGIATTEGNKLRTSQEARQEAIDLSLKRYNERAGINRARSLEDIASNWARRQFMLAEEKKTNAAILGRQKRSDEISLQEIERKNLLRKAINNQYR